MLRLALILPLRCAFPKAVFHRVFSVQIPVALSPAVVDALNTVQNIPISLHSPIQYPGPFPLTWVMEKTDFFISGIHLVTGWPWWATLAFSAVFVKTFMLAFAYLNVINTEKLRNLPPYVASIRHHTSTLTSSAQRSFVR